MHKPKSTPSMMKTEWKHATQNMNTTWKEVPGKKNNVAGVFTQSRKNELLGLLKERTLEITPSTRIGQDERISGSLLVD